MTVQPKHISILAIMGVLFFIESFAIGGIWFAVQHKPTPIKEAVAVKGPVLPKPQIVYAAEVIERPTVKPPLQETPGPITAGKYDYVEVIDGCDTDFEGECLRVRSGPGTNYSTVGRLRNNMVLRVDGSVQGDEHLWYKVIFDEWLRYPERVQHDWYVASEYVRPLKNDGQITTWTDDHSTTSKEIYIDISEQTLTAMIDGEIFMTTTVSTGHYGTPTPTGSFSVFKKTPTRYMQGPLPGNSIDQYYDLPGVPWNLYFEESGLVIHGAYWHENFGETYSHGCVNLIPEEAEKLYSWADLNTKVVVQQ